MKLNSIYIKAILGFCLILFLGCNGKRIPLAPPPPGAFSVTGNISIVNECSNDLTDIPENIRMRGIWVIGDDDVMDTKEITLDIPGGETAVRGGNYVLWVMPANVPLNSMRIRFVNARGGDN